MALESKGIRIPGNINQDISGQNKGQEGKIPWQNKVQKTKITFLRIWLLPN